MFEHKKEKIVGKKRQLIYICLKAKLTKNTEVKNFSLVSGRKVAVDASMCIYQFLIAVRQDGSQLTNEDGETTRYTILLNKGIEFLFFSTCPRTRWT
jgi:hypothetical protein